MVDRLEIYPHFDFRVDWYLIAEKPAPAHPGGCAAFRMVLVTVPRVSRSGEHFPDGFDLHLPHEREKCVYYGSDPLRGRSQRTLYRGTSLIRNSLPLGPFSRTLPRALWWSWGGGRFLMSEVPLYMGTSLTTQRATTCKGFLSSELVWPTRTNQPVS